ncbi:hypothetical protein TW95_gp0863 [Pandoravirus inopinatum]|uniref:DUF5848 domain-containing protein n=1 Tax=Pandoravirus inopinatum TaxID=1605721 RepID=A0A0B5JD36_9VIRU|nr:hypothetical protein TW95_gp0863 [Pandoravirus inopinatum]AJF97597.1 hypothetical protein [Pandoravirus inopinatum]
MDHLRFRFEGLFTRLNGFLDDPTAPGENADFGLFLMENSGMRFKSDADLLMLREVYHPFWAALIQLAYVRTKAVEKLPWPPTPKTAYRHATHTIFSGKHQPLPDLLEEWSTLDVSRTADDVARKVSVRAIDRIEEAIEITERRADTVDATVARLMGRKEAPPAPLRRPSAGRRAFDILWRNVKMKKWFTTTSTLAAEILECAGPTPKDKHVASMRLIALKDGKDGVLGEAAKPIISHNRRADAVRAADKQAAEQLVPYAQDQPKDHSVPGTDPALDDIRRAIDQRIQRALRGAYRGDLDAYRYQQHNSREEALSIFVGADTPTAILREMEAKGYKVERSHSRVVPGFDIVIPPPCT